MNMIYLGDTIEVNTSIKTLNLSWNSIEQGIKKELYKRFLNIIIIY